MLIGADLMSIFNLLKNSISINGHTELDFSIFYKDIGLYLMIYLTLVLLYFIKYKFIYCTVDTGYSKCPNIDNLFYLFTFITILSKKIKK